MVWEGTFNILVWCLPIATDFSGFSAGFFLSFSSGARGKILGGTILVSNTWKWVDLVNFTSYNPVSNYLKNNRSNRIFPGWIFRFHPRLDKIFGTLTVTDQVKLQSSSSCAALKMREIIIWFCMGIGAVPDNDQNWCCYQWQLGQLYTTCWGGRRKSALVRIWPSLHWGSPPAPCV